MMHQSDVFRYVRLAVVSTVAHYHKNNATGERNDGNTELHTFAGFVPAC